MKENDKALRKVTRDVERDRRELEREEKKLEAEIKKAAKTGNKQAATVLAKQLINVRKQKTRTYGATSKVQAVSSATKAMGANVKLAETMATTTKTMTNMNKMMNPTQVARTMQEFDMANTKMGMTEEVMNDALDDILTESGDEEEQDAIVAQVLDEIGIEVSGKVSWYGDCNDQSLILCLIPGQRCPSCSQRNSGRGDDLQQEQGGRRGDREDAGTAEVLAVSLTL